MEENINLLTISIDEKKKVLASLPAKYKKASFLFTVSEKLVELTSQDADFDFIIDTCGELFPQADNILIFSFEQSGESLELIRSLKRKDSVIKEKRGDIVDRWALRHNQYLLVDDLTKDFRFDYAKTTSYKEREIRSLIAHPVSIRDKVMGVVRVESKVPGSFTLDDSRLLSSVCDLSAVVLERATLFKEAEELAIRDSLTSLCLKDYFYKRLGEEISRSRVTGASLGVAMLDIDDFKNINDTHGHIVGDIVLKKLSRILNEIIGDSGNVIARFGGEEFIFLVIKTDKAHLLNLAESIRKKVSETTIQFRRKSAHFTVSVGAALFPEDGQDAVTLVDKVDHLLYKAKREGKNRVCIG